MTHDLRIDRRLVVAGGAAGLFAASSPLASTPRTEAADGLALIEAQIGGRVGLAALDTSSGAWIGHRSDERFAMCSTFKVLLAAVVLDLIDRRALTPERKVAFTRADLLAYAPRTSAQLDAGALV
jgi:beta-lactamase class A